MNYYETLQINPEASEIEIKKAYRKLSLQYHPDKSTGDSEKFKQINEAYQVLGNKEKKSMYDMQQNIGGDNPFMNMGMPGGIPMPFPFGNMERSGIPFGNGRVHIGVMPMNHNKKHMNGMNDMNDIFKMFFNMSGEMNESIKHDRKPSSITKDIHITIQQAYSGMNYPLEVERWIESNNVKHIETETIYVPIPKGVDNNELIILEGKGNCNETNIKGDIKLFVKITNNTSFIRNGLNLHYQYTITLKEALMGFAFQLEHLNGKTYTINSGDESIVRPGTETTIKGMGFERNNVKGNIVIKFDIVFPKTLTKEQKKKLNDIL